MRAKCNLGPENLSFHRLFRAGFLRAGWPFLENFGCGEPVLRAWNISTGERIEREHIRSLSASKTV